MAPRCGEDLCRGAAGSWRGPHRQARLGTRGQQRVAQQAGHGHRPHAARDRRDRAGDARRRRRSSTSPRLGPQRVRFMPTSMTTAPGLTQSPRDAGRRGRRRPRGRRARAAARPAGPACASGRWSRWRSAPSSSCAIGLPNRLRAPDHNGLGARAAPRPRRSSSSITPDRRARAQPGTPEREQARRSPASGRRRPWPGRPARQRGRRRGARAPAAGPGCR